MASIAEQRSTTPTPPLNPLRTSFIPEPKEDDGVPPTPPPAYFEGPNPNRFIRTGSWGAQEVLSPTSQQLQEQYTEYFTDLFTKWIGFGILFWKYGLPAIKWICFFYIRKLDGLKLWIYFTGWFMVWVAPGLYFRIVGLEIGDVPQGTFKAAMEDTKYKVTFWGTWGSTLALKFASLWWMTGYTQWWSWILFGLWVGMFGF